MLLASAPLWSQEAPPDRPKSALDLAEERAAPDEEREPIETDRDSFTPATTTAGRGRFILESAHTFLDNRGVPETHSFPESVLRFGISRRLELRLGWNYEVGGEANEASGTFAAEESASGVLVRSSTVSWGVKALLTDPDGLLPRSAVILGGRTPTSGPATDTHFVGTYVAGWEFGRGLRLDAALRYATASEREDRFNVWAPSVVLKAPLGERWNAHVEYFGLMSSGRAGDFTRHYVSPGAHFLLTPDVEIGARLGWGLNDQSTRFFVNSGLGVRF